MDKITWTMQNFPEEIKHKAKVDALQNGMSLKDYMINLIEKGL